MAVRIASPPRGGSSPSHRPNHGPCPSARRDSRSGDRLTLHVHYVPRREGDGLALPWTGQGQETATKRTPGNPGE